MRTKQTMQMIRRRPTKRDYHRNDVASFPKVIQVTVKMARRTWIENQSQFIENNKWVVHCSSENAIHFRFFVSFPIQIASGEKREIGQNTDKDWKDNSGSSEKTENAGRKENSEKNVVEGKIDEKNKNQIIDAK